MYLTLILLWHLIKIAHNAPELEIEIEKPINYTLNEYHVVNVFIERPKCAVKISEKKGLIELHCIVQMSPVILSWLSPNGTILSTKTSSIGRTFTALVLTIPERQSYAEFRCVAAKPQEVIFNVSNGCELTQQTVSTVLTRVTTQAVLMATWGQDAPEQPSNITITDFSDPKIGSEIHIDVAVGAIAALSFILFSCATVLNCVMIKKYLRNRTTPKKIDAENIYVDFILNEALYDVPKKYMYQYEKNVCYCGLYKNPDDFQGKTIRIDRLTSI